MRPVLLVILTVGLLSAVAATASPAASRATQVVCSQRLRALKTLSDPHRTSVDLQPIDTTVAAINAHAVPHPTPTTRSTKFTRHVWRVIAQITKFRLEPDGDLSLVLFDSGSYLIARIPAPQCLPKTTRAREAIIAARAAFVEACGRPTQSWKQLGAVAAISGVGLFDGNSAELHPVTGIKFLSGCGA